MAIAERLINSSRIAESPATPRRDFAGRVRRVYGCGLHTIAATTFRPRRMLSLSRWPFSGATAFPPSC